MQIPSGLTMRLSKDVWDIALEHAELEGLSTPRQAIERIVRLHSKVAQPATPPTTSVESAIESRNS